MSSESAFHASEASREDRKDAAGTAKDAAGISTPAIATSAIATTGASEPGIAEAGCPPVDGSVPGQLIPVIPSTSPLETMRYGEQLGQAAEDGDTICLVGDLGAGKTTLAQGLARGLGITARVTSPTFTLVQEYEGRLRLYHLDCYRLEDPSDLEPLGADDWLGRNGVCVIEWPEHVQAALPADRLELQLESCDEMRIIRVLPRGDRSRRLALAAGLMGIVGSASAGILPGAPRNSAPEHAGLPAEIRPRKDADQ